MTCGATLLCELVALRHPILRGGTGSCCRPRGENADSTDDPSSHRHFPYWSRSTKEAGTRQLASHRVRGCVTFNFHHRKGKPLQFSKLLHSLAASKPNTSTADGSEPQGGFRFLGSESCILDYGFMHSGNRVGLVIIARSPSDAHKGTLAARKPSRKRFFSCGRAKNQPVFSRSSADIDGYSV